MNLIPTNEKDKEKYIIGEREREDKFFAYIIKLVGSEYNAHTAGRRRRGNLRCVTIARPLNYGRFRRSLLSVACTALSPHIYSERDMERKLCGLKKNDFLSNGSRALSLSFSCEPRVSCENVS